MIIYVDKSFDKDIKKIDNTSLKKSLRKLITQISESSNITDIQNIKKLKGTRNYYRIRLGDFRIGLLIIEKEVLSVYEKFIINSGNIKIGDDTITVAMKKKRNLPLILETMENYRDIKYNWIDKLFVNFIGATTS